MRGIAEKAATGREKKGGLSLVIVGEVGSAMGKVNSRCCAETYPEIFLGIVMRAGVRWPLAMVAE